MYVGSNGRGAAEGGRGTQGTYIIVYIRIMTANVPHISSRTCLLKKGAPVPLCQQNYCLYVGLSAATKELGLDKFVVVVHVGGI